MAKPSSTILVVDDSESALEFASLALEEAGFQVDTAINVAQMVACVGNRKPDLVLVDVNMPELLGHDLVPFLRDVYGISAPIVLFSDTEEGQLAELTKRAKADGYVRKDSDPEKLLAKIRGLLAARADGTAKAPR
jgi:DNA-binding response OmpR family regulator